MTGKGSLLADHVGDEIKFKKVKLNNRNLKKIEREWTAACIRYLRECLAGQHLCEAVNCAGLTLENGAVKNDFKNDAEVNNFFKIFDPLVNTVHTRHTAFQAQIGDPLNTQFTDIEIMKYRSFLYYAGAQPAISAKINLGDLSYSLNLNNNPNTKDKKAQDRYLELSDRVQALPKKMHEIAEKYLVHYLQHRQQNNIAKSILINVQKKLEKENFNSGHKIKVGGVEKMVPLPVEKMYGYIGYAASKKGDGNYRFALCKSVETIIVADDHRKKSRHHGFYQDLSSDLEKEFNIDLDASINAILDYINSKENENKWGILFKKFRPSEIERMKTILEFALLSDNAGKQAGLKKAMVLAYDFAKKLTISTHFAKNFCKNMSTLLIFRQPIKNQPSATINPPIHNGLII